MSFDFFNVLTLIGGLALFLYGMRMMGDGLSKASGGKMATVLEHLTSTPVKALLVGAGVTAVIQSSSATAVMVVGFVNSAIMKLTQATYVMIGANVGTTVTSWLLSVTGIEGGNFFLQLLKPSSFSPVLAIVGVVLISGAKTSRQRDIGSVLTGFGMLMIGMDTMSDAVRPLADSAAFTDALTLFSNPVVGLLAGFLLTIVVQSSSASVGIFQALCRTGTVTVATAIPVLMGENLGDFVTAMISSIGASKEAKRAALVQLYYKIAKVAVFMAVYYTLNAIFRFTIMDMVVSPLGVAVIHSLFNIAACLVFAPMSKLFVRLSVLTIPTDDSENESNLADMELKSLDNRFLDNPSVAIERSRHVARSLADMAARSVQLATGLLLTYDAEAAREVDILEARADRYDGDLSTYLMKLNGKVISERDSEAMSAMLHCIGEFESITDHAQGIAATLSEMQERTLSFSDRAIEELQVLCDAVDEVTQDAATAFKNGDLNLAAQVEPLETVIDQLDIEIKRRHVKRLRKGKCTIDLGFMLSDIVTDAERIAAHSSNVAISLEQVASGDMGEDHHEYLSNMNASEALAYRGRVLAFTERYHLK